MTEGNSSSASNGIEVAMLEKRLEGLRDTQESVQGLSLWCQANKKHSTPIIDTWLRVLRRSPVEKRLTMFYLANDVVQHAKKKGDVTVVNQWAVATQKATPHVRSPSSVSTAIIRIFKIWEERGVYSKDTVADLIALVSKHNPTGKELPTESKKKPEIYTASDEKVKEFQSSALAAVIKLAYKLKSHLGVTFRTKQYVNMNMEQLIASIKDRQHGMSVVENMAELLDSCRVSENKLVHEVDERRRIVEAAEVAIVFYENVRAEALIVSNAYKSFTERVIKTKEKVDEMIRAFAEMEGSPIPSPDRLSPFDEVKVMLPSLAELEASQAQASLLQSQTNQNSNSDGTSSNTNNIMQSGMLASGSAYDLMSASQWPNYAMQLQMMQQQMAQAYASYQADSKGQVQALQQQKLHPSSEIGTIPLPPDSAQGQGHLSNPQHQQGQGQHFPNSQHQQGQGQHLSNPQLQQPQNTQPPLPSPVPPPPSTPSSDMSTPYDPTSLHQYTPKIPSGDFGGSGSTDYGGEEEGYQEESFEGNPYSYDDELEDPVGGGEEYLDSQQQFNSAVPIGGTGGRYHPYSNSTPRRGRDRRLSEGTRPPFSSQGQGAPRFRNPAPVPFNPRNPNTTPVLRRGGPRFNSFTPRGSGGGGHLSSPSVPNTQNNLLRLAQYQVDPPAIRNSTQNEGPFGYPTKDYNHGSGVNDNSERLNGNEEGDTYQPYANKPPPLLQSPRGRGPPGLAVRGPRGFKPQIRGRGSPAFRGGARGRPPRRGNYFIL